MHSLVAFSVWKPLFSTHRFVPLPWNLNKYPENVLFVKQQKANKWATRTLFSSKSTIHFSFEGIYTVLFHFLFKHSRTAAGTSAFQESIYSSIHLSIFFISNAERRHCACWLLFSDYWLVLRFERLDGRQRCPPPPFPHFAACFSYKSCRFDLCTGGRKPPLFNI